MNPALAAQKSLFISFCVPSVSIFLAATWLNHKVVTNIAILNGETLEALLEGHQRDRYHLPETEENIYYLCDRFDPQPISSLVLTFCFGGYL